MSKQRSTLLPKTAAMSNKFCVEHSSFRQSRMLLRQKVERCFDIVLVWTGLYWPLVVVQVERSARCLCVMTITFERNDLWPSYLTQLFGTLVYHDPPCRSSSNVKVIAVVLILPICPWRLDLCPRFGPCESSPWEVLNVNVSLTRRHYYEASLAFMYVPHDWYLLT